MNNWRWRFAAVLWAGALTTSGAWAEATLPSDIDIEIANRVGKLMRNQHISRHELDDTISERIHKQFLDYFDFRKVYFLANDIANFAQRRRLHDDELLRGDLSFPYEVYRTYLVRLESAADLAHKVIDMDHDFAKEEQMVINPENLPFANTPEELSERWRVKIKHELLSQKLDGKTMEQARDRLHKSYRNVVRHWKQMDSEDVVELYLTALTTSYDPHSTYMSRKSYEDFKININLSLEGIGALLQSEDGVTMVKEVVPGGAAERDGRLKPNDKIVGVGDGEHGDIVDIYDMRIRDVVKLIRGKAGTKVRLELIPAANPTQRMVYALTRQRVELTEKEAKGEIIIAGKSDGHPGYRIGVVHLPSFYADDEQIRRRVPNPKTATNDVRRIVEDFKRQGIDGVVMDLTKNGGGLLNEAINLTGLFIDEGPVVQVKDAQGHITPFEDEIPGVVYDGPLLVLVTKSSASASEIFAGAIQDYGRGIIVGDASTHGKGTVQKVLPLVPMLEKLGSIKVTMQQFYRVNGDSTQNRGVVSDLILPSHLDHEDFSEAKLDYALAFSQIAPAAHQRLGMTNEQMLRQLKTASQARVTTDKDLLKLTERKNWVREQRAQKLVTFSEEIMKKERELLGTSKQPGAAAAKDPDADDVPDDLVPDGSKKDKPFGGTPYTKEVLAVMSDYIRLMQASLTAR